MVGGIFQLLAYDAYHTTFAKYINAIQRNDIKFIKNLYEQNTINPKIEDCLIKESIYSIKANIFGYLIKKSRYHNIKDILKICITVNRLEFVKHIFYKEKYRQTLDNLNEEILLSIKCKNSDIFNFLKEKLNISTYINEILIEAITQEKLEIVKECVSKGVHININNIKNCIYLGNHIILNYLLESSANKYCIDILLDFKLPKDYSKKLEIIKILFNHGMPIHKIEDLVFKEYICKECDNPCINWFCEDCHYICDLKTDDSCEQGYSCHENCIGENKCFYSYDVICTHCEKTCDCKLENLELLFYIIDHGANITKISDKLSSKTKIAIDRHIS